MNRALVVVAAILLVLAGACSDEGNSPERANTGDTLERPTTSGATSTTNP